MAMHLRCDQYFVEDEHWNEAAARYGAFLKEHKTDKVVLLELGVGFRMPDAVRWPFERIAYLNRQAMLFRVHGKLPQLPENLEGKGVSIRENSIKWLKSF